MSKNAGLSTELLKKVASGIMTVEQAEAEIRKANERPLSLKISEKGGLSVYGLQRFPVTLYPEQWNRLVNNEQNLNLLRQTIREQLALGVKS